MSFEERFETANRRRARRNCNIAGASQVTKSGMVASPLDGMRSRLIPGLELRNCVCAGDNDPDIRPIKCGPLGKSSGWKSADRRAVAGAQLSDCVPAEVCNPDMCAIEDHRLRQLPDRKRS